MLNARPSLPASPLLTPAELRAALQLSRREYTRQLAKGMPVAFAAGRAKRFALEDVLAWNRQQQARASVPATDLVALLRFETAGRRAARRMLGR